MKLKIKFANIFNGNLTIYDKIIENGIGNSINSNIIDNN